MARVIVSIVSLELVAFVSASFICEVVKLPSLTISIDKRAFLQVSIPFSFRLTNRNLTHSCCLVKDRFFRETLTSVVLFVIGMIFLASRNTALTCEVIELPLLARLCQRRTLS